MPGSETQSDAVPTARSIVEAMLVRTSDAIMANDFDAMDAHFHIPLLLETADQKLIIRSREEHLALFDTLVQGYRAKNVTEIIRVCEVAEYRSPTIIRSMHISHIMSGQHRIEDPVPTLATTELIEGVWRITAAQYAATKNVPIGRAMDLHVRTDA